VGGEDGLRVESVVEVNRLIKQFLSARKIAKVMTGTAGRHQLAQLLRSM